MPRLWRYEYSHVDELARFPPGTLFADGYTCFPGDTIEINGTFEQEEGDTLNYFVYSHTYSWDGFEFAGRVPIKNGVFRYVTPSRQYEELHAIR